MLAASGEFAFVVLQTAMHGSLIERVMVNRILVASILSMCCIPLFAGLAATLRGRGLERQAKCILWGVRKAKRLHPLRCWLTARRCIRGLAFELFEVRSA
jgi:hypothetical protein